MNKPITLTAKQTELWNKLNDLQYRRYLIDGAARSSKTVAIITWLLLQMNLVPGIRIAVLRQHRNHARTTLFEGTIKSIIEGRSEYTATDTNMEIKHSNGSVMRVDGLDDAARVDKILGDEFGHIFINEATQVSYKSLKVAISRLAQNIPGLKKRCLILDCNPKGTLHWLYFLGVLNVDPETHKPLADKELWTRMNFVPQDNPHLPDDAKASLAALTGAERKRLYEGVWCSVENLVYPTFDIDKHVIHKDIPSGSKYIIGIDCGLYDPMVIGEFAIINNDNGDKAMHLCSLYYQPGKDMSKSISDYVEIFRDKQPYIVCDPSASPAIVELKAKGFDVAAANNKMDIGIKTVNDLLQTNRITFEPSCSGKVIEEISQYEMDIVKEKPTGDTPDHAMDIIRYASVAFSEGNYDTSQPFYIF